MKKIFTLVAAALLSVSISSSIFAHSHLGSSNPADGEVVTTPLKEIVLEFDGQIEQGSFMDVKTSSGQAVDIQELIIGEGTLTGTIAEALPNDEYQVKWSIISADGHPSEGQFSFTVNTPVPEAAKEAAEPTKTTETVKNTTGSTVQSAQEQKAVSTDDVNEEESSSLTVIFIVLIVLIVAAIIFFLMKRKKK